MSFGMFRAAGKPGKRRGSRWKEPAANERSRGDLPAALVRANNASGYLVDAAASRLSRIVDLHRVFNVGGIPREPLFFWQLHLAVLFAGNFWCLAAQLVWTQTCLVDGVAHFFSGVVGALGARRISSHLLLLPGRILQIFLG